MGLKKEYTLFYVALMLLIAVLAACCSRAVVPYSDKERAEREEAIAILSHYDGELEAGDLETVVDLHNKKVGLYGTITLPNPIRDIGYDDITYEVFRDKNGKLYIYEWNPNTGNESKKMLRKPQLILVRR